MFGYINSTTDRELKLCTQADFERMINSPFVKSCIEEYRKGSETKKLLPAFVFQGIHPNCVLGKIGKRTAATLVATGLYIMDFDHVNDPYKMYNLFLSKLDSLGLDLKKDVGLAHITPSGKGLRLVLKVPNGMNIQQAQEFTARIMGVDHDAVVKDLSRLSYCPMASDILYINKQVLFSNEIAFDYGDVCPKGTTLLNNPVQSAGMANGATDAAAQGDAHLYPTRSEHPYRAADDGGTADCPGTTYPVNKKGVPLAQSQKDMPLAQGQYPSQKEGLFPTHYNGIPYLRLVEELITVHGGTPQVGNRENTLFLIASDLAKITDRSPLWLESILPTFGLPETEWRATIQQVCKKPLETGLSRKLKLAIDRCSTELKSEETETAEEDSTLPPPMPTDLPPVIAHLVSHVPDHLKPAVCMMCFPSLAAHVNNAQFRLRSGETTELGLSCVCMAIQSTGKSSVKAPIHAIMNDIEKKDAAVDAKIKAWRDRESTKKKSEKGELKPSDPVRYLVEDITVAALSECLWNAQYGDSEHPNQCLYTHTDEIERLYNFAARNGKTEIRQVIKGAFDRDRTGQRRLTKDAFSGTCQFRLNWTASTTIENGKDFFKGKMLTDGVVSRVDFCTIISPQGRYDYRIEPYNKQFIKDLQPYIDRLNNYECAQDEDGDVIPTEIPEIIELDKYFTDLTFDRNAVLPTNLYDDYGKRCRVMTLKKMITIWITDGCVWNERNWAFAKWMFDYSMWNKLGFFYEDANQRFEGERVSFKGHWSPLKSMKKEFTFAELAAEHKKECSGSKFTTRDLIRKYKFNRLIDQVGKDKYVITDKYWYKLHN